MTAANPSFAGRAYRRHAGAGPVARRGEVPQGAAVGLSGRRGQSVHRLRLHARPDAGRPGQLAPRLQGLFASGRLRRLRRDLSLGQRHRSRLLAHARRKFFEAKETDGRRAAEMLTLVRELYAVEDAAKTLDDAARRELRQAQSVPILARIKAWLDAEQQTVLPRSPMGQAIEYALNQWNALCVYATEGFLAIDNNAAERAMKRVAIGRKNWLFAGNDRAGETTALLYTLIASAERHGVDPQRYLTSVFAKLPFTPESEIDQFLPDVWKQDDAAEPSPQSASS